MKKQEKTWEEKHLTFTALKDLPAYNDNEEIIDVECSRNCTLPDIIGLDWISDIAVVLHPNEPCVAFYDGLPVAVKCAKGMARRFVVFNVGRTTDENAPEIIVRNTGKGALTEFWYKRRYQVAQGLWI